MCRMGHSLLVDHEGLPGVSASQSSTSEDSFGREYKTPWEVEDGFEVNEVEEDDVEEEVEEVEEVNNCMEEDRSIENIEIDYSNLEFLNSLPELPQKKKKKKKKKKLSFGPNQHHLYPVNSVTLYIQMEYCNNGSLRSVLHQYDLPFSIRMEYFRQVCFLWFSLSFYECL